MRIIDKTIIELEWPDIVQAIKAYIQKQFPSVSGEEVLVISQDGQCPELIVEYVRPRTHTKDVASGAGR